MLARIPRDSVRPAIIGVSCLAGLYLTYKAMSFIKSFYQKSLVKPLDFIQRYGAKSWVVITEGSTDFGKNWAEKFASAGFNIILIDKSPIPADFKAKIEKNYKVKLVTIDENLADEESVKKVLELFNNQAYDISIVIVNSKEVELGRFKSIKNDEGIIEPGAFKEMESENITNVIQTNLIVPALFIRGLALRLFGRDKRSAVILCTAEFSGKFPYSAAYNAVKGYRSALGLSLQEELKEKIDVLVVNASGYDEVATVNQSYRHLGRRVEPPI
ncbi:unnamed protein product [Blepharisma stoltei]|uniref:Uncharacterized protein n=1 Tax=Blepharisma stoltei TaxID=1481888 RepID=A0AAU9JG59_9CILI|nr:unnamed protein product [Blepharisma stoltei]